MRKSPAQGRHKRQVRRLAPGVSSVHVGEQVDRTLISKDSGWYHVGEPGGGEYRGYTYIYTDFLPRLDTQWAGN